MGKVVLKYSVQLVVIIVGISVAIWLNKLNDTFKEKKREVLVLESFIVDLESDIENYEFYQIPVNNNYLKEVNELIYILKTENYEHDSLQYFLTEFIDFSNWTLRANTYESLKSGGDLDIISNLEIRQGVTTLYEFISEQSKFVVNMNFAHRQRIENYLIEHTGYYSNNKTLELKNLQDPRFINLLVIWSDLMTERLRDYQQVLETSRSLKKQILEELDSM